MIPIPQEDTGNIGDVINKIEYKLFPEGARVAQIDKAFSVDDLYIFGDFDITLTVTVLDTSMNLVSNIQNYGEGPGEYLNINDFTINKTLKTIDILSHRKLIRYNFKGEFIEEFKKPSSFYRIQHLEEDKYLAYIPSSTHPSLKENDSSKILWVWDVKTNHVTQVYSPLENINTPFFRERNNIRLQNDIVLFSANFFDTVYRYNKKGEIVNKWIFNSKKSGMPVDLVFKHNGIIPEELKNQYYIHLPNLLEDDSFFLTNLLDDGKFKSLIYSKRTKNSYTLSMPNDNLNNGFIWIKPLFLKKHSIYTVAEPSYFVSHLEKGITPNSSPFYDFSRNLTINSPLILTIYHLKPNL